MPDWSERNYLLEWARIIRPGVSDDALPVVMSIGFYADESEATGQVFTLAGFLATPSAWTAFCPKWRQMLCDSGPWPVTHFHTADIEAGRGDFDGWAPSERRQIVTNALNLLTDTSLVSNLWAFGCTWVMPDFNAVDPRFLDDGSIPAVYERAYRVLFHNIIRRTVFNDIEFVFDEKEKVKGRVQEHFEKSKAAVEANPEYRGTLGDLNFKDDRKVIPLQAADLLAYEMRRHTWTRVTKGEKPIRDAYGRIKDSFTKMGQGKPPYRERVFRCYDRRFLQSAQETLRTNPNISESDFLEYWLLSDEIPED